MTVRSAIREAEKKLERSGFNVHEILQPSNQVVKSAQYQRGTGRNGKVVAEFDDGQLRVIGRVLPEHLALMREHAGLFQQFSPEVPNTPTAARFAPTDWVRR